VTPDLLTIGQVAETTGLAVSAVRYYDEIGLIETSARVGGKRRFAPEIVGRVSFVQRAQEAGFSLDEIGLILDDTDGEWQGLVAAKLAEITERRNRLDEMIGLLTEIQKCGCEVVAQCPLSVPTN
jgi:MerR family transcriptional regulator, redox-sensitive transcriptional activator SoxR